MKHVAYITANTAYFARYAAPFAYLAWRGFSGVKYDSKTIYKIIPHFPADYSTNSIKLAHDAVIDYTIIYNAREGSNYISLFYQVFRKDNFNNLLSSSAFLSKKYISEGGTDWLIEKTSEISNKINEFKKGSNQNDQDALEMVCALAKASFFSYLSGSFIPFYYVMEEYIDTSRYENDIFTREEINVLAKISTLYAGYIISGEEAFLLYDAISHVSLYAIDHLSPQDSVIRYIFPVVPVVTSGLHIKEVWSDKLLNKAIIPGLGNLSPTYKNVILSKDVVLFIKESIDFSNIFMSMFVKTTDYKKVFPTSYYKLNRSKYYESSLDKNVTSFLNKWLETLFVNSDELKTTPVFGAVTEYFIDLDTIFGENPAAKSVVRDVYKIPSMVTSQLYGYEQGGSGAKYTSANTISTVLKPLCKGVIIASLSYSFEFSLKDASRSSNMVCEIPATMFSIASKDIQKFESISNPSFLYSFAYVNNNFYNLLSKSIFVSIGKTLIADQAGKNLCEDSGLTEYINNNIAGLMGYVEGYFKVTENYILFPVHISALWGKEAITNILLATISRGFIDTFKYVYDDMVRFTSGDEFKNSGSDITSDLYGIYSFAVNSSESLQNVGSVCQAKNIVVGYQGEICNIEYYYFEYMTT